MLIKEYEYASLMRRLASHSCAPNAEINVWKVEGVDCLAMYCVKDVNVNDVITFDHSAEIEV